jgi:hypothetical protein
VIALGLKPGAFSLTATADAITRTVIALLAVTAAVLVAAGLVRAWRGRRRAQVVIEDVAPVDGIPSVAAAGLSPQLRQAVRQALLQESSDASYSVLNTLEQDIRGRLLRAHGSVSVRAITSGLRSTTQDSLDLLAAGIRAVGAKQAEGVLAAIAAALPAQRGWTIRVFPVLGGTGPGTDVGVVVELAQLGHPPDAVTTFWARSVVSVPPPAEPAGDAQAAAIRSALYRLLDPAALWIAIRLVSRQLAQSGVPRRWRLTARRELAQELTGLQMQLAGQLSLYATGIQREYDRGFAEQALADLAESARLLREYFRPHEMEAAVHERLGWSYRRSADGPNAAREFSQSIRCYDAAARLLGQVVDADPEVREAALERVTVRRTKCRLLSGDRGQLVVARQELAGLIPMAAATARALYNGACLFAIALAVAPAQRVPYAWHAWQLLGRALLADGADGPWALALTDVELESLEAQQRGRFCDELKVRHPELTPLAGDRALVVVAEAMLAIGVTPLENVARSAQ